MTDQFTPDIDDIIIAYHSYMSEDGTHSQDFEVSRDEFYRWLDEVKAEAWDVGYEASDHEAYYCSTHGCTPNPYRKKEEPHND